MGRDKRFLDVAGQPLLALAVDAVAAAGSSVTVVVAEAGPLPPLPGNPRVVVDEAPGEGPLGGIVTALAAADTDVVVVVAGDHPRLAPVVLRRLTMRLAVTDVDAVVLGDAAGRGHPLLGAYRRRAEGPLRAAFDAGERRAHAVFDHLDIEVLPAATWGEYDRTAATLLDLDTPADVRDLEAEVARAAADLVPVRRFHHAADGVSVRDDRDRLAPEEPLLIRAGGPEQDPVDVMTTMRSPGDEHDLALGWLFTEGLYDPRQGPATVRIGDPRQLSRPEDTVTVTLPHPLALESVAYRHAVATASCGVCGRASIDELAARCDPLPSGVPARTPPMAWVLALPDLLGDAQSLFAETGGVHATGLYDTSGRLLALREDVGRHNALDAAIGARVRAGDLDFSDTVAVLSGRIGFELVAKAAAAGIPVVVAVGAPTDLAVRTADRLGLTLVGFVRDGRGNVYSHPGRVHV
jgi:FdhD protein